MLIRCWGSRGSIAVCGSEFNKYGGDTACIEVRGAKGELIIIDAGTGIRALGNKLLREESREIHLLLTHAHWDHLSGFPFFKPIYRDDFKIKVYGPESTHAPLKNILSKTMSSPYFPVELEDIQAAISFHGVGLKNHSIGSINISTIALSHPNHGVGYRLEEGGKAFVFLTDNELTHQHPFGLGYDRYVEFARNAAVLYHDAEYSALEYKKTRGWGHSIYTDAVRLALSAGVKTLGLFHHNQERVDDDVDRIEAECRKMISDEGSAMRCFAVATGTEAEI